MADTPTSAAAMTALHELVRLKGMDAVIDYHYQMAQSPTPSPARERHEAEHDRLVAIRNAAEPAAWEAARAALTQAASAQVEAVQAQLFDLQEEVAIDDKLLAEHDRLLKVIPACDAHGDKCIPHAIEWVKEQFAPQPARTGLDWEINFKHKHGCPMIEAARGSAGNAGVIETSDEAQQKGNGHE